MGTLPWIVLGVAVGALWGARAIGRRRRRAGRIGRWGWGISGALVGGIGTILLAGAGYLFWYFNRTQPEAERRSLFQGIEYVRDVRTSPRPMVVHVATVDLRDPNVRFLVTPAERTADGHTIAAQTTSAQLVACKAQLAINGNYFFPFRSGNLFDYYPRPGQGVEPCGVAASLGHVYSERVFAPGVLYLSKDNQASFDEPIGEIYNAINGNGHLARDGQPLGPFEDDKPYPRAAMALNRDASKLILIIIDGKQPGYSEGATLAELAQASIDHGAHTTVRLDEGGSATLAYETTPGRAGVLNIPINNRIPYRERAVANHLAAFAKRR